MAYKFTHSPFVFDVWVPFNGHRFKNTYVIRTKDGREVEAFPNGGAWGLPDNSWVEDSEVLEIKLLSNPTGRNFHKGARRLKRDIEYFGTRYPVWCGDTFVWEDELPPGFRITPTEVYATLIGEGVDERIKFMVARGVVVPETSNHPRLSDIESYALDPLFWWDNQTKIFSHSDICHAIHYVHLHRKCIAEDIQATERLDELCTKLFKKSSDWIPMRKFLVDLVKQQGFETVEANLKAATMINEDHQKRFDLLMVRNSVTQLSAKERELRMAEALNELRGGRPHHMGEIYDIAHVLLRPDINPGTKTAWARISEI